MKVETHAARDRDAARSDGSERSGQHSSPESNVNSEAHRRRAQEQMLVKTTLGMTLATAATRTKSKAIIEPPTMLHPGFQLKIPSSATSAQTKTFSRLRTPICFSEWRQKTVDFSRQQSQGMPPYVTSHSERFGLVVGSGGKGQTFLFWKSDLLFQLPVSYWKDVGWVNSPGYRDGVAYFDRPVNSRCLECHGTYFDSLAPPINRYSQSDLTVGITCEKCHGPGREHVQRFRSKSSGIPPDPAILNPARFSRDRQMDLCAWCHAGHGEPILPTFSYTSRRLLWTNTWSYRSSTPMRPSMYTVARSNCSRKADASNHRAMTCLTCHDVHMTQKDSAAFSEHCLHCHKVESHPKIRQPIANNCVDCHMPKQKTNLIVFNWNGQKVSPEVRNHWIKVYPRPATQAPAESQAKFRN